MTNVSKENLLKILLNEPNESPSIDTGIVISDGTKTLPGRTALTSQLSYNNYSITLSYNDGLVTLFDNEYNVLFQDYLYINNTNAFLRTLDIDEEGNLYGIASNNNGEWLVYLNNITQKNADGEYELYIRKSYSLTSMINAMATELGTGISRNRWKLKKSPIDSRFIIVFDGVVATGSNYNLFVINYRVNVGSTNDYEYRVKAVGTYAQNITQSMYVNWEDDNVFVYLFSMNSAYNGYDYSNPGIVKYYWSSTNFAEGTTISTSLIYTNNSCIKTGILSQALLTSNDKIWFIDAEKNAEEITFKIFLYKNNTLYTKYTLSNVIFNFSEMLYVNNQLFISSVSKKTDENYRTLLFHVIEENLYSIIDFSNGNYTATLLITNDYNLYGICLNDSRFKYIYNSSAYNGTEYFCDKSVTAESMTLYGINKNGSQNIVPIFSRNLYNKVIVGNSIISTAQIPFTYLNNSIITEEQLISKSDNVINEYYEEIEKNQYEELYINNIDSLKVFDNNIGSTYNQNCSLEVINNISNGFEGNYKITHYRINYKNGTKKEHPINHITRTGRDAIIEIYVKNENIENIQIFDKNFKTPFITIDLNNYELNKIYKITEHVKVE